VETMSWEARRLRVALAVQQGQHEAEIAALRARLARLEARLDAHLRAELERDIDRELEAGFDPGLGLADDGGPVRPPVVPALNLEASAGGRAFDVLMGGAPVTTR